MTRTTMEKTNRIIKFRAWHKENKMMWIEIDLFKGNMGDQKIEDFELMQFTGLKDKNGKEIYEGDVVFRKDDDLIDGNGSLCRGFQGYFKVVWHQGGTGYKTTYDEPISVYGYMLQYIPGRFVRKPHIHVVMPERVFVSACRALLLSYCVHPPTVAQWPSMSLVRGSYTSMFIV